MPVDNELYNRLYDTWWDENTVLGSMRNGLNPGRFGYFKQVLLEKLRMDLQGKKILDVGCGGGLLAEEFARLGCAVTGIDPSELSLETARRHARESGLQIDSQVGAGESLPCEDGSFDIVYCCDVLEHVQDPGRVIVPWMVPARQPRRRGRQATRFIRRQRAGSRVPAGAVLAAARPCPGLSEPAAVQLCRGRLARLPDGATPGWPTTTGNTTARA